MPYTSLTALESIKWPAFGRFDPDPYQGFDRPWTPLGNFRLSDPLQFAAPVKEFIATLLWLVIEQIKLQVNSLHTSESDAVGRDQVM